MATISDLQTRPSMRHAYLLLLDGCPFAWTDEYSICTASGSPWWSYDERIILSGLTVPNVKVSLDMESGLLEEDTATFKVLDLDETTIPEFFGGLDKDYKLLGIRLQPGEDPAPAATADQYGDALTLWNGGFGSYLGLEAIGPDGERHHYSCLPHLAATFPGHDHPSNSEPLTVYTEPTVGPYLVEGRKVTLWRLVYDEDTQTWPSPATQFESNRTLLWWGTLRQAGKVDGRVWSFSCSGPASWLRKPLNTRPPSGWFRVRTELTLTPAEAAAEVYFRKRVYLNGYVDQEMGTDTFTVTAGTLDDVVNSIATALNTIKSQAGTDGVWTDPDPVPGSEADISFTADQVSVWMADTTDFAAKVILKMHWKVWRFLGYDPQLNLAQHEEPQPQFAVHLPGIYFGTFSTTPFGTDAAIPNDNPSWTGGAGPHVYNPLYPGGVSTLSGEGGQDLKLTGPDGPGIEAYVESQTIRPPSSAQIDGLDADASRWWVFRGQIQRPGPIPGEVGEVEEIYQVARLSWKNASGKPGVMHSSDGIEIDVHLDRWVDPRLYGLNFEPLDPETGWAGRDGGEDGAILCAPLAVWGLWDGKPDNVGHTLIRLLTSTGTAEWVPGQTDPGDNALVIGDYLTAGVNDIGAGTAAGDLEIFDLSLGIPQDMVDTGGFESIGDITGELPPGLQQSKLCALGPVQSEELIAAMLAPRDWAISLREKKYGVFQRSKYVTVTAPYLDIATYNIGVSDLAYAAGDPSVDFDLSLRATSPFDSLTLNHTGHPVDNPTEGQVEKRYRARDTGARARQGTRERTVQAPDLPAREWWTSIDAPVSSWTVEFQGLWERQVAEWLSQPHRLISGLRISRPKGQYLYPGQPIRLTLPHPANSTGSYGFTAAIARVVAVTHEADSCAAVVDLLVQATPSNVLFWGPLARVVDDVTDPEDRHDPATRTFFLTSWGGIQDNSNQFEDLYFSAGTAAKFWVLQYDGIQWVKTCEGVVESVEVGVSLTYTNAGLTGTFYNRMYALICLAPYDAQDVGSWPRAIVPINGPINGLPESIKLK